MAHSSVLTLCVLWRRLNCELYSFCNWKISAFWIWGKGKWLQLGAVTLCESGGLSSQYFYLPRLDNRLWLFGFYFCLSHLEWIVSRLSLLVACQHKPANLVQNLIISLLFSTHLNSSTVQICQKCSSVSTGDWSFLPGEYLYPHSTLVFFQCMYVHI